MKKARKRMLWIGAVLLLVGAVIIFFNVNDSPLKREFHRDVKSLAETSNDLDVNGVFQKEEFADFPMAIQRYLEHCGYIGTPKMKYMKMEYHDVDFMQSKNGPALTIDYTQYNFIAQPSRLALIDSGLYGIPFEGYDYFLNGKGGMKGVIGKLICLFHQTSEEMDRACLATFLAECLFAPTSLLQDYITLEELDEHHIQATISYKDLTASGVFTFNDNWEMVLFTTEDRRNIASDGTVEQVPWSAVCGEYRKNSDGIFHPTVFQAVWNYEEGDFIYFDGNVDRISYAYEKEK